MPPATRKGNPELTSSDPASYDIQDPAIGPPDQTTTAHRDHASMESLVDSLQRQLSEVKAQLAERPRTNVPVHTDELKMRPPETFNGKPASQLREFITQLRLVFAGQPSRFQNDKAKVIYAASFL